MIFLFIFCCLDWPGGLAGPVHGIARRRSRFAGSLRAQPAAPGRQSRTRIGRRHPGGSRSWRHCQGIFFFLFFFQPIFELSFIFTISHPPQNSCRFSSFLKRNSIIQIRIGFIYYVFLSFFDNIFFLFFSIWAASLMKPKGKEIHHVNFFPFLSQIISKTFRVWGIWFHSKSYPTTPFFIFRMQKPMALLERLSLSLSWNLFLFGGITRN